MACTCCTVQKLAQNIAQNIVHCTKKNETFLSVYTRAYKKLIIIIIIIATTLIIYVKIDGVYACLTLQSNIFFSFDEVVPDRLLPISLLSLNIPETYIARSGSSLPTDFVSLLVDSIVSSSPSPGVGVKLYCRDQLVRAFPNVCLGRLAVFVLGSFPTQLLYHNTYECCMQ